MSALGQRLSKIWNDWNTDATPGIHFTATMIWAGIIGLVALAVSAVVVVLVGQVLGAPLPDSVGQVFWIPPFVLVLAWLLYRAR